PGACTIVRVAAPLGQSRPREIGLSGSPSIWVMRPSLTKIRWPQPTAQKGQTDGTTRSEVSVRARRSSECGERAESPRPRTSPGRGCWRTGQLVTVSTPGDYPAYRAEKRVRHCVSRHPGG